MGKKPGVAIKTTIYNTFRGADFSTDPSLVEKYRSPLCTNIVPDAGGMPEKRPGWRTLHELTGKVNGLYFVKSGSTTRLVAHVGQKLLQWTEDSETAPVELMTGLKDARSRGVFMRGALWILTGGEYITTDGTVAGTARVTATDMYVPTTIITRMPTGGGVTYEDVNMLTPLRKNAFQTDGTSVEFLLDSSIDNDTTPKCWVWGTEQTAGTDFTFDRSDGTVTFMTAPPAPDAGSADGLVVEFSHTVSGYADRIEKCTIITTYGVGNNDRVIFAGNPAWPNLDWTSGYNDPTYVPDLSYSNVGTEQTAILGYCRLGASLGIIKEDNGQDNTIFLRTASTDDDGDAVFPLKQAISGVGAVAPGSFAELLDDPLFLSATGVMALTTNTYTSERIAQNRSYYVNARLTQEPGLAEAEAVIYDGMYLLSLPNGHVYCLDGKQPKSYRSAALGDFEYEAYYWENVPAHCWLRVRSGAEETLYFGTADGRICRFSTDMESVRRFNDDDTPVRAVWATKYDDDGTPSYLKTMIKQGCCVTIKPYARSSGTVYYRTDRTEGTEQRTANKQMDILNFADIDFERFTFNTDDSPQEIFFRRRVKNYKRLQIIIRNDEESEGFGIYQITKHFIIGNYAKR